MAAAAASAAAMVVATAVPAGAAPVPAGAATPVAAPTAGCGTTPTLTSGTHSIQSGGKNRGYILHIPDNYDNSRPYRLIFGLHWLGGTAEDVATGNLMPGGGWSYYGLLALSNDSTIFVAPQALNNGGLTGWGNTGGEDVTLMDDILDQLQNDLCIDTEQIFSTGFSYGAAMSFALACARPNVFRAIAALSGGPISGCEGGTEPVAYMGVHGIGDPALPISLGRQMRDRFVTNNGCTAQSAPEPASGSGERITTVYEGCSDGHPVIWHAFDGGHTPLPQDRGAAASWVPEATWEFFTQFESSSPAAGR